MLSSGFGRVDCESIHWRVDILCIDVRVPSFGLLEDSLAGFGFVSSLVEDARGSGLSVKGFAFLVKYYL